MFNFPIKAKSCLGITIAACSTAIALQAPTQAQKIHNVSQVLDEASGIINQQLPMKIDSTVRWDSTFAGPGKLMTYNYTLLTYSPSQWERKVFTQQFYAFANNMLCKESSAQLFRDNDVALNVNVYDNQRSLISQVSVSPSECQ